eukprot:6554560-Prorocentrum_lima.AAC.1
MPTHKMISGRLTRIQKQTKNPGAWPELWRQFSPQQRLSVIEAFRANKTGVFSEEEAPQPRYPKVILERHQAELRGAGG